MSTDERFATGEPGTTDRRFTASALDTEDLPVVMGRVVRALVRGAVAVDRGVDLDGLCVVEGAVRLVAVLVDGVTAGLRSEVIVDLAGALAVVVPDRDILFAVAEAPVLRFSSPELVTRLVRSSAELPIDTRDR